MKITTTENNDIQLEEVFNSIILKTADGEEMVIHMRDSGFEFKYQGEMYFAKKGQVMPFHKSLRGNYLVNQTPQCDSDNAVSNESMTMEELCKKAHQNSKDKGFWEESPNIAKKIALMHSELSEALEADRKGNHTYCTEREMRVILGYTGDGDYKAAYENKLKGYFAEEMADICIRVFDLCGYLNIDLEKQIEAKMRYNSLREYKQGKKY